MPSTICGMPVDPGRRDAAETADSTAEAQRLRTAIERRGPVEARLGTNPGQRAIVQERDRAIERLVGMAGFQDGRLLDIGCGDGSMLGRLIDRGLVARGEGIDLLPERIDRARSAWPHIDFQVADAARLPFEDATFDGVLAMTVFSSIPAPTRSAVAAEIARVVRPGGAFIWYDLRRPSPSNPDVRPFDRRKVRALFPHWRVEAHPLTVAPPLARRLGRATGPLYPILARIGVVLTHEVGLARRPPAGAAPMNAAIDAGP